jgi:multidrug efflux system membrane fusion protein
LDWGKQFSTQKTRMTNHQNDNIARKWMRTWIVCACVALLGSAVFFFQRRAAGQSSRVKQPPSPPALQVATVTARKGDIGVYVNALGAVTPVFSVSVKSRVDGQLMSVNYREGQMVREGDSLVEIDPRPFQAQLTQMEGQYARDQALLENAHVDLARYQAAYAKNAVPKQTLDTQVATVHQFEGTVKLDEGQVENAKVQLAYCHITSPISGRVGLRLVDPGNIVHATDTNPLVVITELQPITVIFSVAEDFLPEIQQQLRQGRTLAVEAFDRAQQSKLASGTLLTLDNQIDTTTGTIKLKALFTNEDSSLFPNQFVNARLLVNTQTNVTLVPASAIQRNPQGAFVYVLTPDQTVEMRTVLVGVTDGNMSAVEGVDPGALIAADNFNRLQEGIKVVARKPPDEGNPRKRQTAASGKTGGSQL